MKTEYKTEDPSPTLSAWLPKQREFAAGVQSRAAGVDPSGSGLFAIRGFEQGETIGRLGGILVHAEAIDEYVRTHGRYGLIVHDEWYVCPRNGRDVGATGAINHSCEPNVGLSDALTFTALGPIEAAPENPVELLIDYAMTGSPAGGFAGCRCGTPSCRGSITRGDWLDPELQRKYFDFLPPFKKRAITGKSDYACGLTRYLDENTPLLPTVVDIDEFVCKVPR